MEYLVETPTKRVSVPEIEEIIGRELPVLDHGFVRVVDYMGGDESIVQAARVSYGKGTKKLSQDRGLIRYLMRHWHSTPFEMCEIKLHVKLPIFVARQWIRHRTANVNEYSARYSILDKEFYVPDRDYLDALMMEKKVIRNHRLSELAGQPALFNIDEISDNSRGNIRASAAQSSSNGQGRDETLGETEADHSLRSIRNLSELAYRKYSELLNEDDAGESRDPERKGLARELARIVLPTNYYTQWYWKIDLHNLFHFLYLRADSHAQFEIREYAEVIAEVVKRWVPIAWEAFVDYRQDGGRVSAQEIKLLRQIVEGRRINREDAGLSEREWKEFVSRFGDPDEIAANAKSAGLSDVSSS